MRTILDMLATTTSPEALRASAEHLNREGVDPEVVDAIVAAASSLQATLDPRDRREDALLVLEGAGMSEIARAAGEALHGRMVVADPDGRVLATAGDVSEAPALDLATPYAW